ncbi:MAG TPA: orotate phosphoribosyltransferase [Rhabdochlamydiaceae bacterium]|jgi:uridine monophosphate synthetase
MTPEIKAIILELHAIGAIQFGQFILKSGVSSPIYIDLRLIISYPALLKRISAALWTLASRLSFERICGVPYTALPIATAISLEHGIPMVLRRKEAKEYGTKKMIEGVFHPKENCLIIEDVVTSAGSILETAAALEKEGMRVEDAVVVLYREQGGKKLLKEKGIFLHPLISVFDLLKVLFYEKKISEEMFSKANDFFQVKTP